MLTISVNEVETPKLLWQGIGGGFEGPGPWDQRGHQLTVALEGAGALSSQDNKKCFAERAPMSLESLGQMSLGDVTNGAPSYP